MKFLNKITIFLSNVVLFFLTLLISFLNSKDLICGTWWDCYNAINIVAYLFLAYVLLVFPGSLLTLPLRPSIFEAWRSFAIWAMPVMLAITAFIVVGGEGSAYFSFGFGPLILLILYGAYFVASFGIIVMGVVKARKTS